MSAERGRASQRVWLFDLDDTLHHASHQIFAALGLAMNDYMVRHLGLEPGHAAQLRQRYWQRYGATLLGLVRHHQVSASHFLDETHALPQLEAWLRASRPDLAWLRRLPGRKILLTNAPQRYAHRVLQALDIAHCFERVLTVEQMRMFGQLRPKPDARMFRHVCARLKLPPSRCILVEDSVGHLKSVRSLNMGTVWMRGWMTRSSHGRPPYVGHLVRRLNKLRL